MRKSLFIAALATAACTEATPPRAAVAAVTVTPSSATIAVGGTQQLSAKAFDAAATELTDRSITWTAVPGSVATVSGSGLVTAIGAGVVTVTATSEGKAGTASVTISVPVASIIITPATAVVGTGASRQLGATVRDSTGAALSGRTVSWSSSNSAVASVDATSGLVTAISTGTAIISAGAEEKTGSAMIYVSVPVATVIAPSTASLVVGGSYQLTAEARNASGEVMPERSVTWSSSNAALASVNGSGLVTGVSPGSVTVTATSEGKSAQVAVTVRAANAASAQIVAGENHTCALTVGGDAYCWGHSLAAGNGATTPSGFVFLPTLVVGGHKWSALSAARFYTFGITTDGDLYVWGRNYPGAGLGTPNFAVMTTPQKVSELKFKAIAAGSGDHSCGLTTTGAAYCWGANQYGQLGNGTTTTSHASVAVAGGLTFEKIAVAGYHSVALTAAGKAFVWGGGYAGDGAAAQRNSPVEVSGGHAFTAVSSGHAHTLGLKADGSIWVWGSTGWGALGLGGQSYYAAAPTKLATPVDFKAVLAGWQDFSVALSTTGVAYTWGKRVGTAPLDDEYDPTPIQVAGTQPFATAAGGMGHVMFLGANGDSYGWGTKSPARRWGTT